MFTQIKGLAGDHPTSKEIELLPAACLTTHRVKAKEAKNHSVHLVTVETKSQRKKGVQQASTAKMVALDCCSM